MQGIHGGDIYRNQVKIDFSVNVNPLGMPEAVMEALKDAVGSSGEYPDITAEKVKCAVSEMLSVPQEFLLFGNGASELFMAIVHGIQPGKTVIPVPAFYGYEYAAGAVHGEIIYYPMKEEAQFALGEDFFHVLSEDTALLFLANPNNPTGKLIDRGYLKRLLKHCKEKSITVVLDECFIEFCGRGASMLSEIEEYENLILVRAFTKIFAIPGVRLGYLVCSNQELLKKVGRQLPEWNLSVFAQAAGCVCVKQLDFVEQTVAFVKKERQFLEEGLSKLGFRVFIGEANFIFFQSDLPLYELLLAQGILIRDCRNFRGLQDGYYRIAVRNRQDNEKLLKAIGEIREAVWNKLE